MVAAQKLRCARGDKAVTRTVESEPSDVVPLRPLVRNGEVMICRPDRLMKMGLERGHQRDFGQLLPELTHRGNVGRIMRRRHGTDILHCRQDFGGHVLHTTDLTAMDRLEPNG